MAAGLGFKDFVTGEVLTAADVDGYLMQGIWVFASAAARDAAVTSPQEGNFAYLKDTNVTTYYTGSAWANVDTTGMTNPMTTTGDIIYSSPGSTPVRLGIGTANQVLRVNSGATAPEWATPAGGASALTYVGGATFSGSSAVNVNDVFSATYNNYVFYVSFLGSSNQDFNMRLRVSGADNTSSNYTTQRTDIDGSTTAVARFTVTEWSIYTGSTTGNFLKGTMYFPFESQATGAQIMFNRNLGTSMAGTTSFNVFNGSTSFTGFTMFPASGTITGSVKVYGLANS
jgi:hypothetical protein